jgi:hypothetical protein
MASLITQIVRLVTDAVTVAESVASGSFQDALADALDDAARRVRDGDITIEGVLERGREDANEMKKIRDSLPE